MRARTKAHAKRGTLVATGDRKADALALRALLDLTALLSLTNLLVPRRPLKRRHCCR